MDLFERRDGRIVLHRIYDRNDLSIGSIHRSNNCGLFKIISFEGMNYNSQRLYKVRFLKTGTEKIAHAGTIKEGKIKDQLLLSYLYVGKRYKCNCGSTCTITSYAGLYGEYQMYNVVFDTGYSTISRIGNITRGKIKDPLYTSKCGIGFLGTEFAKFRESDRELYNALAQRWRGILRGCYDPKDKKYRIYGALNIHVSERWHNLSNFLYDVISLPGFDRERIISGELQLHKDKLQKDRLPSEKIYSKDTCCWLTIKENNPINIKKS